MGAFCENVRIKQRGSEVCDSEYSVSPTLMQIFFLFLLRHRKQAHATDKGAPQQGGRAAATAGPTSRSRVPGLTRAVALLDKAARYWINTTRYGTSTLP